MDYDIERERRKKDELHKAFRAIFPLANDNDLPSTASQIAEFLKNRIELEVNQATFHFKRRVVRILCEVSPPKTHTEDMARIVVNDAKEALAWKEKADKLTLAIRDWEQRQQQTIKKLEAANVRLNKCEAMLESASHLLQASIGPADQEGCDSWKETRQKWFDTWEKELG